jgi:hypothetical protein
VTIVLIISFYTWLCFDGQNKAKQSNMKHGGLEQRKQSKKPCLFSGINWRTVVIRECKRARSCL